MKVDKKIIDLINYGISGKLLSQLGENQVSILHNRLSESKKETKEQSSPGVTTITTSMKITTINPTALNNDRGVNIDGVNLKNQGGQLVATQMKEDEDLEDLAIADETNGMNPDKALALSMTEKKELEEKFESKAQQKMFWARCGNGKTKEEKKWCKMAKEFSDKTTKKDYKKMPKKINPEKSVPKSEYNEEFTMKDYGKKLESVYSNLMGKKLNQTLNVGAFNESDLEKAIVNIIERRLSPKMTKKELMNYIKEQAPTIAPPATEPIVKPNTPYSPKPGPKPGPKAGKESPTIAPPKPMTPTKPSPSTPYSPKPGPKPGPKAMDKDLPNWLSFNKLGIKLK